MGYQNTPAHHTASAAWQAGDDVWPGPLVIRRANVYADTDDLEMPGADLGWVESIGPAIQAITALGKTAYDIRRSQLDKQHARNQEADAALAATLAAKAANEAAVAAATNAAQVSSASQGSRAHLLMVGVAVAGALGLGAYLLRRKK